MTITVSPPNPYPLSLFPSSSSSSPSPSPWPPLLPLLRPSLKSFQLPNSSTLLIDTALAKTSPLHIIATTKSTEFPSVLLNTPSLATAILPEPKDDGPLDLTGIQHAIVAAAGNAGDDRAAAAAVVVRAGTARRRVRSRGAEGVEVEVPSACERDHLLLLLGSVRGECRGEVSRVEELLRGFVEGAAGGEARFEGEKVGGKPALRGVDGGVYGFESAREVVEKEVGAVMAEVVASGVGREQGTVWSVHFADVNGLSRLENYIFAGEVARYFESKSLPFQLTHSTVLSHEDPSRGFAISIAPVSPANLAAQPRPQPHKPSAPATTASSSSQKPLLATPKMTFSDPQIRTRILAGCNALITAEPKITEYDTIVGDGDCGYTLRDGALFVQTFITDKDLSNLPSVVAALVSDLEVSMGGTSGALYCIFLTALSTALATEGTVAKALEGALEVMKRYTKARVGDRTMMDALIPFIEALGAGESVEKAVAGAKEGVRGTEKMGASLGRSAYLDEGTTRGVPDPGAFGLGVLLEAMAGDVS